MVEIHRIEKEEYPMSWWERLQSVLVAVAAVAGLAVGVAWSVGAAAEHVVLPALMVMLAAVFVQMDATQLAQAKRARAVVAASLVLNFVCSPRCWPGDWVRGCWVDHRTCGSGCCCCW